MEKKFKILRFIGTVYKILGIITAVLTLLGAVGICLASVLGGAMMDQVQSEFGNIGPVALMGGAAGGVIIGGALLVWGAITALLLLAAGEGISLLVALEENTRTTALYMQQFSQPEYPAETYPAEPYTPQP
jgi:hypothetical protein